MSKTITDKISELLNGFDEIYASSGVYNPRDTGLYLHVYNNSEGIEQKDYYAEDIEGLDRQEIGSLVSFGFNLHGVNTDDMYKTSDVYFARIDEDDEDYSGVLASISSIIRKEMNTRYMNYIVLEDEGGDMLINYDLNLVSKLEELQKTFKDPDKLEIRYFNLRGNYLTNRHRTLCLMENNLVLDEDIDNLMDLILKDNEDVKYYNKDVVLSQEEYEKLSEREIMNLAYFALKHKVNLIFTGDTYHELFTVYCRKLFSGTYLPVHKYVQYRRSLGKTVLNYTNPLDTTVNEIVVVNETPVDFKVNCIPFEEIMNLISIESLSVVLEPSVATVNMDMVFDLGKVVESWYMQHYNDRKGTLEEIDNEDRARVSLIERIQNVCVRVLEKKNTNLRNVIIFVHKGSIYFGGIPYDDVKRYVENTKVSTLIKGTGEVYETTVGTMDLLPTQLFLTDRKVETTYEMPELDEGDLKAIYEGIHRLGTYGEYARTGEYDRAIYAVNTDIDNVNNKFYRTCMNIDETLVKNATVFPDGGMSLVLRMAP